MRIVIVLIVVVLPWAVAAAQCEPEELTEAFGFPTSTAGALDIRIWLGGGIVVPETVYRLYEEADGQVRGEKLLWLWLHDEGEYIGKPTNRGLKRLMRKNCEAPQIAGHLVWCRFPVETELLRITLDDLQPGALRSLSDSVERDCGGLMEDGETVTVALVQGPETHCLSIGNPEFCCSEPVCAFVNHARDVVQRSMRLD